MIAARSGKRECPGSPLKEWGLGVFSKTDLLCRRCGNLPFSAETEETAPRIALSSKDEG